MRNETFLWCRTHVSVSLVYYVTRFKIFILLLYLSVITTVWPVVLCEYSKFRIESNSYFSIQFFSKRAQLIEIFEYLPSPIFYLFISSWLTDYRQKYRLPVAVFNHRLSIYRVKHACAGAPMSSMYLISAADHTSVKRRRRPCRPHNCAVDGGGVGTHIGKANDYASLCRLALIPGVTHFAGYRQWWREGRARRLAVGGACIEAYASRIYTV